MIEYLYKFYVKTSFIYNYSVLFDPKRNNREVSNKRRAPTNHINNTETSSLSNDSDKKEDKFSNKSVQIEKPNYRKMSVHTFVADKEYRQNRLLTYYMNLINLKNSNMKNLSLNQSLLSLEFLKLIFCNSVSAANSNNYSTYYLSLFNMTTLPATSCFTLDQSDLNIIQYLLKTLKIKQIYMYNLALHKKNLKEIRDSLHQFDLNQQNHNVPLIKINQEKSIALQSSNPNGYDNTLNSYNTLVKTEIQFPLLVEYEELFTINCNNNKRK